MKTNEYLQELQNEMDRRENFLRKLSGKPEITGFLFDTVPPPDVTDAEHHYVTRRRVALLESMLQIKERPHVEDW